MRGDCHMTKDDSGGAAKEEPKVRKLIMTCVKPLVPSTGMVGFLTYVFASDYSIIYKLCFFICCLSLICLCMVLLEPYVYKYIAYKKYSKKKDFKLSVKNTEVEEHKSDKETRVRIEEEYTKRYEMYLESWISYHKDNPSGKEPPTFEEYMCRTKAQSKLVELNAFRN